MNIPEKETFGFFDELGQRTKFTEVSIMVLDRAFRCQIVSDFYFSRDCLKDILDFIISNSRRQALFDGRRTNIRLKIRLARENPGNERSEATEGHSRRIEARIAHP